MAEKRKRIRFFFIASAVFLLLLALPQIPRSLINVETGIALSNVELIIPAASRIFAPFLDFPFYFANFIQPKMQILSWIIWLSAIWLGFSFFRLKDTRIKKARRMFRGLIVTIVSFSLFIIHCILFPMPQYRLKSHNPDEIFLDLHSHTIYSHDGIITPERNLRWHLGGGFGVWAVTEHANAVTAVLEQEEILRKNSLDGVVIAAQEIKFKGAYLNLLGIEENIDRNTFDNASGLIREIHSRGGAVIVPHYWADTKSRLSMKELAEAGADAFEIAGNSSVPLAPELKNEIISLCRKEGLVMVSGSNWHGWQAFCNCWTGFTADGLARMDDASREKAVLNGLQNRETEKFRVIGYRQKFHPGGYFFEPFTGFLSYFCSLDIWQRFSWLFWAAAICFLLRRIRDKRKSSILLWTVISLALIAKAVFILHTWQSVSHINDILPQVSNGLFLMAIITICLAVTNIRKRVFKS